MTQTLSASPVSGLTIAVSSLTLGCMDITKEQAIQLFGGRKALQNALGLKSHSAIVMWAAGEPIPEAHALRIRFVLRPEAFDARGRIKPSFLKCEAA